MSQQFIPLSVPNFSGNEKQYVNEAVISEWVSTGGSKVSEFEEKIAEYTHMPRAVACNSGTSGLHLAMLMAGVGRGDEVLAPALTFIAAVNPIRYAGAEPVFIGCGESLCLCPALAGEWLAANTEQRDGKCVNRHTGAHVKALLAVHVFGNMANMPGLVELCRKEREPGSPYLLIRAGNAEQADRLKEACCKELGEEPTMEYFIGGVVAINAGPNLIGLIYRAG